MASKNSEPTGERHGVDAPAAFRIGRRSRPRVGADAVRFLRAGPGRAHDCHPRRPRWLGSRLPRVRPRGSRGHEELLPVHDRVRREGAGRRAGDGYRHRRARLRRIVGGRCARHGLDAEGSQGRQVSERKRNDGAGRQVVEGPRLRREGERGGDLSADWPCRGGSGRGRRRLHGALHPVSAERSVQPHPDHLPLRVRLRRDQEARHGGRSVGQGMGHEEPAERWGLQRRRLQGGAGDRPRSEPVLPPRPAAREAGQAASHSGPRKSPPAAGERRDRHRPRAVAARHRRPARRERHQGHLEPEQRVRVHADGDGHPSLRQSSGPPGDGARRALRRGSSPTSTTATRGARRVPCRSTCRAIRPRAIRSASTSTRRRRCSPRRAWRTGSSPRSPCSRATSRRSGRPSSCPARPARRGSSSR